MMVANFYWKGMIIAAVRMKFLRKTNDLHQGLDLRSKYTRNLD